MKIDKNLKSYFYYTLFLFYLIISIRIKADKKYLLNIKKIAYK